MSIVSQDRVRQVLQESTSPRPWSAKEFYRHNKRRPRSQALGLPYIRVNAANTRHLLPFDIDLEDALYESFRYDIVPFQVVLNEDNGHTHTFILLKDPVHRNRGHSKDAWNFYLDTYAKLKTLFNADLAYNPNTLSKNPNCLLPGHRVVPPKVEKAYTLTELMERCSHVQLPRKSPADPFSGRQGKRTQRMEQGRNCLLHQLATEWGAGHRHKNQNETLEQLAASILRQVHLWNHSPQVNNSPKGPVGPAEEKDIAKSAAKYLLQNCTTEGRSKWASAVACKRWNTTPQGNAQRDALIVKMKTEGWSLTQVEDRMKAAGYEETTRGIVRNAIKKFNSKK